MIIDDCKIKNCSKKTKTQKLTTDSLDWHKFTYTKSYFYKQQTTYKQEESYVSEIC